MFLYTAEFPGFIGDLPPLQAQWHLQEGQRSPQSERGCPTPPTPLGQTPELSLCVKAEYINVAN